MLNVEFFSFLLDEGASVFSATSRYKKWEDDIPIEKRNHQPLHLIITRRGVAGVNDHDDFANRKIAMLRRILSNDVKPDLEALTIHKDKHMTPLKLAYALMQDVEVDCPKPKKIRLEENYRNIMTILKEAGADESVLDDEIGLEDRVKKIEKSVLAINLNGERSIKLFVFWSLFEIVRGIVRFSADVLGDNISDKYMDLHNKYSQALLSLLIACFIVIVFYFCEKNKSKTINPSGIKGCSVEEVEVPFTLR